MIEYVKRRNRKAEEEIIFMCSNEGSTRQELAEKLKISYSSLDSLLRRLVEENIIYFSIKPRMRRIWGGRFVQKEVKVYYLK
jgi:DNA-binding transcriptional regulator LsrR (DeoR family)